MDAKHSRSKPRDHDPVEFLTNFPYYARANAVPILAIALAIGIVIVMVYQKAYLAIFYFVFVAIAFVCIGVGALWGWRRFRGKPARLFRGITEWDLRASSDNANGLNSRMYAGRRQ